MTLTELCKELRNWFTTAEYHGTFTITNGEMNLSELISDGSLQDGQYFRVVGSVFNDGVYQHPYSEFDDEVFDGAVWAMAVPKEVVTLLNDINDWMTTYASEINKPYQSESFGGYSYSLKGSLSGDSNSITEPWKAQFSSRLNRWRKAR